MGSRSSHRSGQESLSLSIDGHGEDTRLSFGPSGTGQSYSSSPRINISQLSSDLTSSRASTMRQVEEEVRKLATAEKQSRKVSLRPHSSSRGSHVRHKRSQNRKERGRDEVPAQSGFICQSVQSNFPEGTGSSGMLPSAENEVPSIRRVPAGSSASDLQSVQAVPISEESSNGMLASERQITRQGDGKESKDKSQSRKTVFVTATSGKSLTFSPLSAPVRNNSEQPNVPSNIVLSRDFGQMFPSSECIMVGSGEKENVGVQTSDSLLYPKKGSKNGEDSISVSMSDKESTVGSLKDKRPFHRGKQASESKDACDSKKRKGKAGHKGASDPRKPSSSGRHLQEVSKLDEVSKGKESFKKSKNRDASANKEGSSNHKKTVDRSSHKGISKNKHLPVKSLKIVPKVGRLEKRAAVCSDKGSGSQEKELSSRSSSESEDRTITSGSSLSHSFQSIDQISDHDKVSSGKLESIEAERRHSQHSAGDNSMECSRETEHCSQHDVLSSTNEESTTPGHQSPGGKQYITSDDRSVKDKSVQGLKGGAEESSLSKAPTQLLISSTEQSGVSRHITRYADYTNTKYKSTNVILPPQTERKNLKNKSDLFQHISDEEGHDVATIQHSDSERQIQNKSGTPKVAWMDGKERVIEKKPPVRFDVRFSNQENLKPRRSKFSATTTTTTTTGVQEEPTHSTEILTLQVRIKTIVLINFLQLSHVIQTFPILS